MPGCSQREVRRLKQRADRRGNAGPANEAFAGTPKDHPQDELGGLIATIESAVIPRLLLARREQGATDTVLPDGPSGRIAPSSVYALVDVLLRNQPVEPLLNALLGTGVCVDDLFDQLLAPAARELGVRWENDGADFTEVTLAVGRLQQLLRELSYDFLGSAKAPHPRRSILLAPCPGEQHLFGTLMVCEYFRRAGWEVDTLPGADLGELASTVRNDWFAVVGLSAGSTRQLDSLAATIRALRRASMNRAIGIMAGGPVFANRPELVARVGADAGAEQAHEAPARAEQLLGLLAADCCV